MEKIGLIVVNGFVILDGVAKQIAAYKKAFRQLGIALKIISNEEVNAYIDGEGRIVNCVDEFDFCLYLDKDIYRAELLKRSGLRLFNEPSAIALCDDKMWTALALTNQQIRMPKTISSPLNYARKDMGAFLLNVKKKLEYPIVVKQVHGSLGKEVFLVNNDQELHAIANQLRDIPHIYQQYIESKTNSDIRVFVVGGKVVAAMKRTNSGDFRHNIGQGAKAECVRIGENVAEMAVQACQMIGLDFAGVDIIVDEDDRPYLIEVNSNAFFTEISRVCQIDMAMIIASYIASVIYK